MRTSTITTATVALCALLGLGLPSYAQEPAAESSAEPGVTEEAAPEGPAFNYQTGNILLPNKVATLHLAGNYRYLDPAETEKLLVAWGNEPGNETQGAIVPTEVDPMGSDGWAVILTYENDGHVDDSDAQDIDYDDLLADMKEGTEDHNEARKQAGYDAVHLVGWAEKPHYDAAAKKLYWAKELQFESAGTNTLNYDVRVLGREGVLSMNAVASIGQLTQIRADMKPLIDVAEFNQGYRYAEFDSKTDRMAEYGLGALIAGGVAAKLGLFAKLGALLLAFKKLIIVGLVAIGGFVAKLFGKKKDAAA
jgi:uncharacterized membrane-anchored protein